MDRYAEVTRKTGETDIVVKLDLDGSGVCDISTGVPFSTTCSTPLAAMACSI